MPGPDTAQNSLYVETAWRAKAGSGPWSKCRGKGPVGLSLSYIRNEIPSQESTKKSMKNHIENNITNCIFYTFIYDILFKQFKIGVFLCCLSNNPGQICLGGG